MVEAASLYKFSTENAIPVESIQLLRQRVGWVADSTEVWQETLDRAVGVASAWKDDELVGVGFLVGTRRHAILCDLVVAPEHQQNGIGRQIAQQLMDVVREEEVRYTTLYYDETRPWLKGFYQSLGFLSINDAMQHVNPGPVSN